MPRRRDGCSSSPYPPFLPRFLPPYASEISIGTPSPPPSHSPGRPDVYTVSGENAKSTHPIQEHVVALVSLLCHHQEDEVSHGENILFGAAAHTLLQNRFRWSDAQGAGPLFQVSEGCRVDDEVFHRGNIQRADKHGDARYGDCRWRWRRRCGVEITVREAIRSTQDKTKMIIRGKQCSKPRHARTLTQTCGGRNAMQQPRDDGKMTK